MTPISGVPLASILSVLLTLLAEHWPKFLALLLTFIPFIWGVYRAWRQWRTREFMSRFSISLNIVHQEEGKSILWIPAAAELELEEVFHRNQTAVRIVRRAAYATTPTQPFLITIPEDDRMSILNEVGNRVEVMLRDGSFAVLAGLPVHFMNLVIGLSCEKGADVRIRKIRALVVEESLLRNVEQLNQIHFDKPHHSVRRDTLRRMAELYAKQPDLFVRIRVALRIQEKQQENVRVVLSKEMVEVADEAEARQAVPTNG